MQTPEIYILKYEWGDKWKNEEFWPMFATSFCKSYVIDLIYLRFIYWLMRDTHRETET